MKSQFLSRELTVWGVGKGLLVICVCFAGLIVVGIIGHYIDRTWYGPRRSAQILEGVNEKTQTLDEQLQIIRRALARNHDNRDARFWFAWKLTAMKRYNEAAAAWIDSVKRDTGLRGDTSFCDRGMCLLFAHRQAEAIIPLEETIRRRPEHVSARGFLAAAYADLGLTDRVEEELVKLANLKPQWQQQFETCTEWPEEHKAALVKLEPYLKRMKKEGSSQR